MKYKVYVASENILDLDPLGDQGWELTNFNPMVFSKRFRLADDSEMLPLLKKYIETLIFDKKNGERNREALERSGFRFVLAYDEADGKVKYGMDINCDGARIWRLEFDCSEWPIMVGLTFGSPMLNVAKTFYNKETIDRNVPREILEKALESHAISEYEYEE